MGLYREDIVNQAKAWLGKKESDGSHKEIIDIYNKHKPLARSYKVKYTDAWCATFVSAVAIAQGATAIIPTECSCAKMIELHKSLGSWVEADNYIPAPGDIIFYDWGDSGNGENKGYPEHVGIVIKVGKTAMEVIEGNYNNSVKIRKMVVDGKYIRGYAVPKYQEKIVIEPAPTLKTVEEIAKEVINGKWGNGTERREKLTAAGYNHEEVQKKVNEMLKPAPKNEITVGSNVIVKYGACNVSGKRLASFVYRRIHQVKQINGDRVVITYKGVVVAAVRMCDLTKA